MTSAFMAETLPPRTYGRVMTLAQMKTAAPIKTNLSSRVDQAVKALSLCKEGYEDRGILRLTLGGLDDRQLTLVEEALVALHERQRKHEVEYGAFDQKKREQFSNLMFGRFEGLSIPSPYAHIVRAVLPDFNSAALTVFGSFSGSRDLSLTASLCTAMDKAGVPLTEENLSIQYSAYFKWDTVRGMLPAGEFYGSNVSLVRAVHRYPTKVNELLRMLLTRGSVESADEVFATTSAISEGAL